MSETMPTKQRRIEYQTMCSNGCGVLRAALPFDGRENDRTGEWIRCAGCGRINFAEKAEPSP